MPSMPCQAISHTVQQGLCASARARLATRGGSGVGAGRALCPSGAPQQDVPGRPVREAAQVLRGQLETPLQRLGRLVTEVRRENNLVWGHLENGIITRDGLGGVDIQCRTEAPLAEEFYQGIHVAERRSRDVHEHGRGPQPLEERPADHAPRLLREQHRDAHDVRPLENFLQGHLTTADGRRGKCLLLPSRPAEHLSRTEGAEELGCAHPNVAEADDADDLAAQLHASCGVHPTACSECPLCSRDLAVHRQHQADGQLRDRGRGVVRGVDDGNATARAGLVIDVVGPDEGHREDLALRMLRKHLLGDGSSAIGYNGPRIRWLTVPRPHGLEAPLREHVLHVLLGNLLVLDQRHLQLIPVEARQCHGCVCKGVCVARGLLDRNA
mmetsp:Transcript_113878/g.317066  ORF Transcript_113878/g.317066 Transcript_113878/m.317066 type:complete len:383 (+) Transcript_113878:278-1426(+)